jgi:CIC family chloride channel protein
MLNWLRAKLATGEALWLRMLYWLRAKFASGEVLWVMVVLGAIAGLGTGLIIVAFRSLITFGQNFLLSGGVDDFEQLLPLERLGLTVAGGLLAGLIFQRLGKAASVGVTHVMERVSYHYGRMPLRNVLVQFFGAALCIVSGQSVGREGPAVHLGAATSSLIGYRFGLPNNSLLVLVACGTAASISASFDTPLAGVIFAMEVVMMEYSIVRFTPVLVASVSAALVSQYFYGHHVAFAVPTLSLGSNWEIMLLLAMALLLGSCSALFIEMLTRVVRLSQRIPVWLRFSLAGLATGLIAMLVPEVMGIGYDSVNNALLGNYLVPALLALLVAKLLATTFAIGLGLPGGVIGPTLVVGAAIGGLFGVLAGWVFGDAAASPGFYVLLGMVGMMSATLQAPLAALIAMLELSGNLNIILPGMLVVVGANLVVSEVFGKKSVFHMLLRERGLDYEPNAITRHLRSICVSQVMDRRFARIKVDASLDEVRLTLQSHPLWLVVEHDEVPKLLLSAAEVAREVANLPAEENTVAPLKAMDKQGMPLGRIDARANLQEAMSVLRKTELSALVAVSGLRKPIIDGVITRQAIDNQYR